MRAIKPIGSGEQIYNTYGDLPNADLLRRYGYTRFGKTKNDVVEIATQLAIDSAAVNLSELHLKKRVCLFLCVRYVILVCANMGLDGLYARVRRTAG